MTASNVRIGLPRNVYFCPISQLVQSCCCRHNAWFHLASCIQCDKEEAGPSCARQAPTRICLRLRSQSNPGCGIVVELDKELPEILWEKFGNIEYQLTAAIRSSLMAQPNIHRGARSVERQDSAHIHHRWNKRTKQDFGRRSLATQLVVLASKFRVQPQLQSNTRRDKSPEGRGPASCLLTPQNRSEIPHLPSGNREDENPARARQACDPPSLLRRQVPLRSHVVPALAAHGLKDSSRLGGRVLGKVREAMRV